MYRETGGEFWRDRVRADTTRCSPVPLHALAQAMATHDLQQARVIGKTERLGGPRYVPIVFVERREDDLPLGLGLHRLQRPRRLARLRRLVSFLAANLGWDVSRANHAGIRRNHHPLETVSQFAHVVLPPVVGAEQGQRLWRDRLG